MSERTAGLTALMADFAQDSIATTIDRFRKARTLWRARHQERSQLLGLDERMLRDIGLSKVDVWHEANKPFWRP
jgi:uncharacterized protein YjiS (DUF1127 family)